MSEKHKVTRVIGLALGTVAALAWLSIWSNTSESLFVDQVISVLSGLWGFCFFVLFVLTMAHPESNAPVTFLTIGTFFGGLFAPMCVLVMIVEKIRLGRKYRR